MTQTIIAFPCRQPFQRTSIFGKRFGRVRLGNAALAQTESQRSLQRHTSGPAIHYCFRLALESSFLHSLAAWSSIPIWKCFNPIKSPSKGRRIVFVISFLFFPFSPDPLPPPFFLLGGGGGARRGEEERLLRRFLGNCRPTLFGDHFIAAILLTLGRFFLRWPCAVDKT